MLVAVNVDLQLVLLLSAVVHVAQQPVVPCTHHVILPCTTGFCTFLDRPSDFAAHGAPIGSPRIHAGDGLPLGVVALRHLDDRCRGGVAEAYVGMPHSTEGMRPFTVAGPLQGPVSDATELADYVCVVHWRLAFLTVPIVFWNLRQPVAKLVDSDVAAFAKYNGVHLGALGVKANAAHRVVLVLALGRFVQVCVLRAAENGVAHLMPVHADSIRLVRSCLHLLKLSQIPLGGNGVGLCST